jgi:hypothetical protein
VLQRVNGDMAFLFLRDEQDADQQLRLTYTDPANGGRAVTMPRHGRLTLQARQMLALAVNVPLPDMRLEYSTSEILGVGHCGARTVMVLYGASGTPGEISLHCQRRPHVVGEVDQDWNEADGTLTLNYTHAQQDRYVVVNDVALAIVNRKRAYTTWEIPCGGDRGFLVSDSYFLRDCEVSASGLEAVVECLPGSSHLTTLLPDEPKQTMVDGQPVPFAWDRATGALAFDVKTPALPEVGADFKRARFMPEQCETDAKTSPVEQLHSLEDLGLLAKGYVCYHATFEAEGAESLIIRFFEGSAKNGRSHQTVGDPTMVRVNGRYVAEASGWHSRKIVLDAAEYLQPGKNTVEVILEKIGRPCGAGGWGMGEPKGLASVSLVGPSEKPWIKVVDHWQLGVGLEGQRRGYHRADYDAQHWQLAKLGDWKKWIAGCEGFDGIGWYRVEFPSRVPAEWSIPLKLSLKVNTDALVYLNGQIVGRYNGIGWQREFYLPDCWLNASGENVIALAVRNAGGPGGLSEVAVRPYEEFGVRRHRIRISF